MLKARVYMCTINKTSRAKPAKEAHLHVQRSGAVYFVAGNKRPCHSSLAGSTLGAKRVPRAEHIVLERRRSLLV